VRSVAVVTAPDLKPRTEFRDQKPQMARIDRLAQMTVRAKHRASGDIRRSPTRGNDDSRYFYAAAPYSFEQAEAVASGKIQVEQHDVRLEFLDEHQRALTLRGPIDSVAPAQYQLRQRMQGWRVILND
jgi:hypothetical protein